MINCLTSTSVNRTKQGETIDEPVIAINPTQSIGSQHFYRQPIDDERVDLRMSRKLRTDGNGEAG